MGIGYSPKKVQNAVKKQQGKQAVAKYNTWQADRGIHATGAVAANLRRTEGLSPTASWVVASGAQPGGSQSYTPKSGGSGSGSGRRGGGGRGGGGGGGGPSPAQTQMDYIANLLASDMWKAPQQTALRDTIAGATTQDKAAAEAAYGALDQWLAANNRNPYADVQLREARFAPAQNAYLQSQGLTPLNDVSANPEDVGANNAFRNVLSLLGAGQLSSNQSRLAESQMGRTYAGQQIGAMDNAMLAAVGQREADAQTQLDNQKRQLILQLGELVGQGATAPDLSRFGIT